MKSTAADLFTIRTTLHLAHRIGKTSVVFFYV